MKSLSVAQISRINRNLTFDEVVRNTNLQASHVEVAIGMWVIAKPSGPVYGNLGKRIRGAVRVLFNRAAAVSYLEDLL